MIGLREVVVPMRVSRPVSPGMSEAAIQPAARPGRVLVQAAAYVAGRSGSRRPKRVSPAVGAFLRAWVACADARDRRALTSRVRDIVDTAAAEGVEERRSWMALDWYCRAFASRWLRAAGRPLAAREIEATAPIVGSESAKAVTACLVAVHEDADRWGEWYGDALYDVVNEAAWMVEWTVGDGAFDSDGVNVEVAIDAVETEADAAVVVGGAALKGAAFGAAAEVARRARKAAWDVASDAARKVAAGSLANDGMTLNLVDVVDLGLESATVMAAVDRVTRSLRPVTIVLQKSALDLLDRMIAAGASEVPE